jgi:hypothetical protein
MVAYIPIPRPAVEFDKGMRFMVVSILRREFCVNDLFGLAHPRFFLLWDLKPHLRPDEASEKGSLTGKRIPLKRRGSNDLELILK